MSLLLSRDGIPPETIAAFAKLWDAHGLLHLFSNYAGPQVADQGLQVDLRRG